jgi:hypothetical protein
MFLKAEADPAIGLGRAAALPNASRERRGREARLRRRWPGGEERRGSGFGAEGKNRGCGAERKNRGGGGAS